MCGQKLCVGFICVPKKRRVRERERENGFEVVERVMIIMIILLA